MMIGELLAMISTKIRVTQRNPRRRTHVYVTRNVIEGPKYVVRVHNVYIIMMFRRRNIKGKCLVSGLVSSKVLNLSNGENWVFPLYFRCFFVHDIYFTLFI